MRNKFTTLTPELYRYIVSHTTPPDAVLQDLITETKKLGDISRMQIAQDQGILFTQLTRIMNTKLAVEVGTFTGYSAISIARGLTEEGKLITCEINEKYTKIAERYFKRAGLDRKISLKLGPAIETLQELRLRDVDIAFIDADKEGYLAYYEALLPNMRSGGLMMFDNVLWHGAVADPKTQDENSKAIRKFNDALIHDPRVEIVILPIADGLTLARKR